MLCIRNYNKLKRQKENIINSHKKRLIELQKIENLPEKDVHNYSNPEIKPHGTLDTSTVGSSATNIDTLGTSENILNGEIWDTKAAPLIERTPESIKIHETSQKISIQNLSIVNLRMTCKI